jgi:hypothetical protein
MSTKFDQTNGFSAGKDSLKSLDILVLTYAVDALCSRSFSAIELDQKRKLQRKLVMVTTTNVFGVAISPSIGVFFSWSLL